jgi:hypothetical protein
MEAPEVPTEHLHEEMHHQASSSGKKWTLGVALSSAILAAFAAVASLDAGHSSNEAMLAQIQSANQWNFLQAKSIKASLLNSKMEILRAVDKPVDDKDKAKSEEYRHDIEEIKTEAESLQKHSQTFLHRHEIMAKSVTLFQISISIAAISVLAKRRAFWFLSLAFGMVGCFYMVQGLLFKTGH